MAVRYRNRKGVTYVLCRGTTRSGKPRYTFAREPKGEVVEALPEGYEIRESVNGVVSLARCRPPQLLPGEIAAVEAALARHPKAHNFRMGVKGKQIVIYTRVGPDAQDILSALGSFGERMAYGVEALQERLDQQAQFHPEMRFTLADEEARRFGAERWCYKSRVDGWMELWLSGPIEVLARKLIPTLGTDAFFELY